MRLLALGLAVSCVLLAPASISARVWYILPDGMGDAPTIQAGIDSASTGDVVRVADGVYSGPGNRDIDFLGKAIQVASENSAEHTIIDCGGSEAEFHGGFIFQNGEGATSVLNGFTIRNGYSNIGAGVNCYQASPTIRRCVFTENTATSSGGGIFAGLDASPNVSSCLFYGNTAWGGAGYFGYYGDHGNLTWCTFVHNTADYGGGVMSRERPTMHNCIVAFSLAGDAIRGCATLECCNLYGNPGGDWDDWCITGQQDQNGNFSADPLFCYPLTNDYTLAADSPCLPGQHPDGYNCGLIGVLGQGCASSSDVAGPYETPSSWGLVKTLFRLPR